MPTEQTIDKEKELLQKCLKQIEEKLGWAEASEWQHRHFDLLSEKIFEATHVQLSAVTLKRLWGKIAYHSSPTTNTLDTLAKFLGYGSWIDFQQEHWQKTEIPSQQPSVRKSGLAKLFRQKVSYLYGAVLLVLVVGLLSMTEWIKPVYKEKTSFSFQPVAKGLPNTVTFTYDASHANADSVFIQQSWNPKLRHQVDPTSDFFACTYYYPGFFQAKLVLNDQIAIEKDLFIKSEGWLATIDKKPVPFYLDLASVAKNGQLAITQAHLVEHGVDLSGEIPITNFHFVEDFGEVSAQNFKLSTEFKNTFGKGEAICQEARVSILCSKSAFIIPFSIKGCVAELGMLIPGNFMNGTQADLTGFGVDFSEWVTLEVETSGNQVSILVNGQPAYQGEVPLVAGKVVGVRYQFHGTGSVKSLQLESEGKSIPIPTL
ncbi:hypothetical protein R9C00_25515 [Flammeovirgaceae bacterium SG7u.111]|nr:hypothetical protein [Flammeovirgaceae bacterium SG7u.132]WPO35056.1 hypothetical protein R9C00_25515 [Flammeovirgaceae bacterium SG7u.111]